MEKGTRSAPPIRISRSAHVLGGGGRRYPSHQRLPMHQRAPVTYSALDLTLDVVFYDCEEFDQQAFSFSFFFSCKFSRQGLLVKRTVYPSQPINQFRDRSPVIGRRVEARWFQESFDPLSAGSLRPQRAPLPPGVSSDELISYCRERINGTSEMNWKPRDRAGNQIKARREGGGEADQDEKRQKSNQENKWAQRTIR